MVTGEGRRRVGGFPRDPASSGAVTAWTHCSARAIESSMTIITEPVRDAVIFSTRLDMAPDSMEMMTAPAELAPSIEPGIYRFKIAPKVAVERRP